MLSYRYPGPRPFQEDEINLFFGREKDKRKLLTFISVEQLVVLFAKSGLGKSSLINAAVIPELRAKGYEIIVARFNSYASSGHTKADGLESLSPIQKLLNEIKVKYSLAPTFLDSLISEEEPPTLWHHLKNLQISNTEKKNYFIFFDQFEELFTYPQEHIREFKVSLAELLNASVPQMYLDKIRKSEDDSHSLLLNNEQLELLYEPIPAKILFTIRSDKFSSLTNLKDAIPGIVTKTYELKSFNSAEAKDAIKSPAALEGDFVSNSFSYEEDALQKMLQYLTDQETAEIESFQLQILCRYVEDIVIKNKKENHELKNVNADQLGDIKNIFEEYYNNLIKSIDQRNIQNVKKLFEEGLIFEKDKVRLSLYKGQITEAYTIDDTLLKELVNTHLLRCESDAQGMEKYELSHDSLIEPILKAKEKRMAEEREKENKIKQEEEQRKLLKLKEDENKKLDEQRQELQRWLQVEKLRSRNRLFTGMLLVLAIIIGIVVVSLVTKSRVDKLAILRTQFRLDERSWFDNLTFDQQSEVLGKDFLFLKQDDPDRYNKILYSYKCAALASREFNNGDTIMALKLAREGFASDSNDVTDSVFLNLVHSTKSFFSNVSIKCKGLVNNARVLENNKILVVCDSGIYWLNSVSGKVIDSLTGKMYHSDYSVLSHDNSILMYETFYDDSAHLINLVSGKPFAIRNQCLDSAHSIAFDISPDKQSIAHTDGHNIVYRISFNNIVQNKYVLPFEETINELSFSPDNNYLAAGMESGKVYLIALTGSDLNSNFHLLQDTTGNQYEHQDIVNSISFSSDSKHILTGSSDYFVNIWNVKSQHLIQTLDNPVGVYKCRFSANNKRVLVGGETDGQIYLWDTSSSVSSSSKFEKSISPGMMEFEGHPTRLYGLDSLVLSAVFYNNDNNVMAVSGHNVCMWNLNKNVVTLSQVMKSNAIPKLKLAEKIGVNLSTLESTLSLTDRKEVSEIIAMINKALDSIVNEVGTPGITKNKRAEVTRLSNLIPRLYDHLKDCKGDTLSKFDSLDLFIETGNSYFYKILLDEDSMKGKQQKSNVYSLIDFRKKALALYPYDTLRFESLIRAYYMPFGYYFDNRQYDSLVAWTAEIQSDLKTVNTSGFTDYVYMIYQYHVSFLLLGHRNDEAKDFIASWAQNHPNSLSLILTNQLVEICTNAKEYDQTNLERQIKNITFQSQLTYSASISDLKIVAEALLKEKNSLRLSENAVSDLTKYDSYLDSISY